MRKWKGLKKKTASPTITPKNRPEAEKEVGRRVRDWIYEWLERERRVEFVINETRKKSVITAKICGTTERTVNRYRQEAKDGGGIVKGPGARWPRIQFGDFDENGLWRLIWGFYQRNPPELPTSHQIYSDASFIPVSPRYLILQCKTWSKNWVSFTREEMKKCRYTIV